MLGAAEEEIEDAESNKRYLEVCMCVWHHLTIMTLWRVTSEACRIVRVHEGHSCLRKLAFSPSRQFFVLVPFRCRVADKCFEFHGAPKPRCVCLCPSKRHRFRNTARTHPCLCVFVCLSVYLSQVIVEGIRTGTVSLDNPSVRTLLETCASNGIGTTGLNTNSNSNSNAHANVNVNHFARHPAAEMAGVGAVGGAGGGRKSPGAGGKKSPSPSPSPSSGAGAGAGGGAGTGGKKAPVTRVPIVGNAGNGNGSPKAPTAATSSTVAASGAGAEAPIANEDAKKSGGGGGKSAAKAEVASKGDVKSPKSPAISVVDKPSSTPKSPSSTPKSSTSTSTPKSADKASRTAGGGAKGKVGLAVPKTLFPELVRLIHGGGGFKSFRGLL